MEQSIPDVPKPVFEERFEPKRTPAARSAPEIIAFQYFDYERFIQETCTQSDIYTFVLIHDS
jgi:hypothetical protein